MEYKNKRRLIIGISLSLLIVFYLFKNISTTLRIFSFIFGLFIFYLCDHMFELEFKLRHYLIIIFILIGAMLLSPLYFIYPPYDKSLHFINPILGCFLFFHIIDREKLNLKWKLFITFMFMISFISIHEMGEYLLDLLWDLKLQGVYIKNLSMATELNPVMSRIDDTMIDIILGLLGSLVFVIGKTGTNLYKKELREKIMKK